MGALGAAGLIFDVAGVLLLGCALLTPNNVDHFVLSAPFYNGNPTLFLALRIQKFDAHWGIALLVLGFALQLGGNAGLSANFSNSASIAIAILVAVFPFWLIGRERLRRTNAQAFRVALAEFEELEKRNAKAAEGD